MSKKNGIASLLGAGLVGAAVGVLFAPKSGKETRSDLMDALNDLANQVKSIDKKDVERYVDKNIKKIKKELNSLSVEKVKKNAKKQAKEIEKSVSDLVSYVKDAGTPILEDAVEKIRLKSVDLISSVLDKLEDED